MASLTVALQNSHRSCFLFTCFFVSFTSFNHLKKGGVIYIPCTFGIDCMWMLFIEKCKCIWTKFCSDCSDSVYVTFLSTTQSYGESATTPSTTAVCPCGWSRTTDVRCANRTGWYRGSASEGSGLVPASSPSTLAPLRLWRNGLINRASLLPLNV